MLSLMIARSALLDALSPAVKVVERRNTIPILSNALLRAEGETLSITTTDLDIEIATQAPAEIKAEGAITVPAGPLADIARKLPADARVTLEMMETGQIAVRAGRSRFALGTLPASDFPEFKEVSDSRASSLTLPAKTLKTLLGRTAFAISTEETRYYLNGTFLVAVETETGPVLRAVATDGWRLARLDATGVEGLRHDVPGVIVPRKAVGEMMKLAEDAGDAEAHLTITLATITLRLAGTKLSSKLIDGTFPDYQRVIPTGNDKHVLAPVDTLKRAVDRVGVIAADRGRAVKLSVESDSLTVAMRNPDAGEAVDALDVEYGGMPLDIGLNGRFLGEILDQVGGDTARLSFADPASPVLIRPREGDDALFVLMPMRV